MNRPIRYVAAYQKARALGYRLCGEQPRTAMASREARVRCVYCETYTASVFTLVYLRRHRARCVRPGRRSS